MPHGSEEKTVSEFYLACKHGNKDMFDRLVKTLTAEEISRLDPAVGSTPLHAAVFYGHADIVRALISRGADRTIRNKFGKLAEDEATTPEIKSVVARYRK